VQSGFQDWLLDAIFELVVKTIFQRLAPICTASLIVVVSISTSAFNTPQDNYERLDQVANLIRTGDVSAAERELQLILRSQPSDPNALNLLGVVRVQQQRPVDAEKLFLSAIRHSPKLVGGYVNLGRLYQDQHKIERAQWAYAEAAKLAPDNSEINYQLASLSVDQGDFAKALLDIQDGKFAKEWLRETASGRKKYERLLKRGADQPIERVGDRLRGLMRWLDEKP